MLQPFDLLLLAGFLLIKKSSSPIFTNFSISSHRCRGNKTAGIIY
jgi:hypothetical protein